MKKTAMFRRAWLYFFVVILAAGLVVGGKVWVEKSKSPLPNPPSQGEGSADNNPAAGELPLTEDKPVTLPEKVLLDVPFTSQAPFREWSDPRHQDACEEAAILMAAHWIKNEPFASPQAAKEEILALVQYQIDTVGYYVDTSAEDTAKLLREYFKHENVSVTYNITGADLIKKELAAGNLVIVPVNGRLLNNPYYTPPGPDRHMIVVTGYDDTTGEFITNDAGIMRGRGYRYPQKTFMSALNDYPSGDHKPPFAEARTAMIVVEKD